MRVEQVIIARFMVAFDLLGTFVFALSGAAAGIRHRLDLFGVLVLSIAAATAGGVLRDVLIGMGMPAAVRDWRYIAVPVFAGLVYFYWHPRVDRFRNTMLWFDAAGLALFAVTGAALCFGLRFMGIRHGWRLPRAKTGESGDVTGG